MTVSDQIIQVLDALCEKFGIVIDWTATNVLPYITTLCTKLVSYEIWTSVAWMGIMICLSVASIIAAKRLIPTFKAGLEQDRQNYDIGWTLASVFAIIGLIGLNLATVIVIGEQIMDIIKCVTFPEMYVFEYIKGLVSSGGQGA